MWAARRAWRKSVGRVRIELPERPGCQDAGRVRAARRHLCRFAKPRCGVKLSNFLNLLNFRGIRNGRKFAVAAGEREKGDGRLWAYQPEWTGVRMTSLDPIAERFGVREGEAQVLAKQRRVLG